MSLTFFTFHKNKQSISKMFLLLEKSETISDDVVMTDLSFGCVCFSGSGVIGREHNESVVRKSQKCQNKNVNVSQLPCVGHRWNRQNNSLSILDMPARGIFKNPKLSFFAYSSHFSLGKK